MADPVRRVLGVVPALAALLVLGTVPMPMFAVAPGPAHDVLPLIRISGHDTFRPEGRLLLTTVIVDRATTFEALRGWVDGFIDVVPERQILPPGVTEADEERVQRSQMDESKLTAVHVALRRVTDYPSRHGPGALVRRVVPGGPGDGRLFAGDLIVSVDGRSVGDPAELAEVARASGGRRPVRLEVRVEDRLRRVEIVPSRGGLGVELIENFPFSILIESGEIGGPSAGLMWAVGVVDVLTPGDLTGGRMIAGSGTIDLDGSVGPIGGIGQKIVAAERAGADVFLVPRGDLPAARDVGSRVELVPVDDVEDAIGYLQVSCGCPSV